MASAIPIPSELLLQIENASLWLHEIDRPAFFAAVASGIDGHEPGPGLVGRSISKAFREFYRPMTLPAPSGVRLRQTYKSPDRD
jgi:hypothetical protein